MTAECQHETLPDGYSINDQAHISDCENQYSLVSSEPGPPRYFTYPLPIHAQSHKHTLLEVCLKEPSGQTWSFYPLVYYF